MCAASKTVATTTAPEIMNSSFSTVTINWKDAVRLGDSNFEFVEVIDGLKDGDRVVVSDMKRFINSTTVKVK